MLYIWPYITFFSWPIMLPYIIRTISSGDLKSLKNSLPRLIVALPIITVMALTVHFNTIIHPFTLADNRHYVFYVFRLLLRHPLVKYAAVPIYFFCAWLAITALGNRCPAPVKTADEKKSTGSGTIPKEDPTSKENPNPIRVSFLLVFLLTTTLSLVTAPLVEPRYFILPWLIWRLHVQPPPQLPPSPPPYQPSDRTQTPSTLSMKRLLQRIARVDRRIWLYIETAWFLVVNLVTCWVFLNWTFEWTQEPGIVQRFMW
jgi:alpha-1,2-glucosyltransferase